MNRITYYFLLLFFITLSNNLSAQSLSSLKSYDLSKLWCADKVRLFDEEKKEMDFPEPMGFIGDNYQRFYIHYTSIIKDKTNPYKYIVKGKTKVKNYICSFVGTITVIGVKSYESDDPKYKAGLITSMVDLKEDQTQKESGHIKGKMTTDYCIDKQNKLSYNTINLAADGFYNNQCEATWTSYKTGKIKKCNWGDFRIPNSGDLDVGAGEFGLNKKYVKNGWWNYASVYDRINSFRKEENRKWWLTN